MKLLIVAAAARSAALVLSGCVAPQLYTRDVPSVALSSFDQMPGAWRDTIDDSLKDAKRSKHYYGTA